MKWEPLSVEHHKNPEQRPPRGLTFVIATLMFIIASLSILLPVAFLLLAIRWLWIHS